MCVSCRMPRHLDLASGRAGRPMKNKCPIYLGKPIRGSGVPVDRYNRDNDVLLEKRRIQIC